MRENICLFSPINPLPESLHIINCVYEVNCPDTAPVRLSNYRLLLVVNGSGTLKVWERIFELTAGDLILLPPAVPLCFTSNNQLHYLYISFIGTRANRIAEELHTTRYGLMMHGMKTLEPIWKTIFAAENEILRLRGEGILLYTFSLMQETLMRETRIHRQSNLVPEVRHYVEDHLTEPTLSLSTIAAALNYNAKYISGLFVKETGMKLSQYITALRIRHAYTLVESGTASVKDLAFLCGFSDPLYFSTVFKKHAGISPREYILAARK